METLNFEDQFIKCVEGAHEVKAKCGCQEGGFGGQTQKWKSLRYRF